MKGILACLGALLICTLFVLSPGAVVLLALFVMLAGVLFCLMS